MAFLLHLYKSIDGFSGFIQDKFHFFRMEVNRSVFHAFVAQLECQRVPNQNFFLEIAIRTFNHCLHFFVSKTAIGIDNGFPDPFV